MNYRQEKGVKTHKKLMDQQKKNSRPCQTDLPKRNKIKKNGKVPAKKKKEWKGTGPRGSSVTTKKPNCSVNDPSIPIIHAAQSNSRSEFQTITAP